MISTDLHPLAYFEYIIDSENILKEIENEFKYSDAVSLYFGDSTEVKYVVQNDVGEFEYKSIQTKDLLIPKLYREFQKTKNHLYSFSLNNKKQVTENYLRIQANSLQAIINNNSVLINNHMYFLLPIRGFVKYINDSLLLSVMERFVLDESKLMIGDIIEAEEIEFDSIQKTDLEIIHSVLDYMNGVNQKREQILNGEDFKLLIKYTTELIEQEKIPAVKKQLQPNISNDLIRFTYWVLHKEFYTTTKVRTYFYEFIQAVFLNFKDSEISSIQKLFGTRTRVVNDNFLPVIITKNLKSRA